MRLYNTLTRQLDEITPLSPGRTNVYTCGPTVYDYAHIGHWFNYVRMDTLIRTLKAAGLQPNWVMNITDVGHLVSDADEGEDKLEKGAKREGKTAWDVAQFYTDYFLEGLTRLNITQPNHIPRATDHIKEQIALIRTLESKGFTYETSDGVYYDTARFPSYADFARLDLDEQQAGARVDTNPDKRNPTDFALWKFSPKAGLTGQKRDMEWESPWGTGFPGWHLECSAMAMKYLGETLDIHAGGIDHIPIHHTNEIAQSEAATGKPFARYWMHSNHITIEGEKISKSLGNGITLEDIETRGYSPEVLRLLVLESSYRSQSKFSWNGLEAARNRLRDYRAMAALRWQAQPTVGDAMTVAFEDVPVELAASLQNDLNTPQALAFLSDIAKQVQATLIDTAMRPRLHKMLRAVDQALGLSLADEPDITDQQKNLIAERERARQDKQWATSDDLRAVLLAQGIGLRDTPNAPIWSRL